MMKMILLAWFVFIANAVLALSVNEYPITKSNQLESSQQLLFVKQSCVHANSNMIFMPIGLLGKKPAEIQQVESSSTYESYVGQAGNVNLDNKFESYVIDRITSNMKNIPALFYTASESDMNLGFVKPDADLVDWQKHNSSLPMLLKNIHVTESITLPVQYIRKESNIQYVLFSKVIRGQILENRDNIPYTNLVSLIASVNMQVLFVVVSLPNGIVIRKFVATGHSGVAKLLEKTDYSTSYDVNQLIDDAFNRFVADIKANLNDDTLIHGQVPHECTTRLSPSSLPTTSGKPQNEP